MRLRQGLCAAVVRGEQCGARCDPGVKDQDWSRAPRTAQPSVLSQCWTRGRAGHCDTVTPLCNVPHLAEPRDSHDSVTSDTMETPGPAGVMETRNKEVNNNQQETKEAVTEAAHSGGAAARAITVSDPEEWLCVAKLPLDTDQEAFTELLSEFGAVKESFLLVSSKTGKRSVEKLGHTST